MEDGDGNDGDGNDSVKIMVMKFSYLMITLMAECLNLMVFLVKSSFAFMALRLCLEFLGRYLPCLESLVSELRRVTSSSLGWESPKLTKAQWPFRIFVILFSACIYSMNIDQIILKCIGDSCHLFLIPCHARLVIPWSSLATGKVSLEVSGIHIEAEGM